MSDQPSLDELGINATRTLALDAVQAANSGHPGTPVALAPVASDARQGGVRAS